MGAQEAVVPLVDVNGRARGAGRGRLIVIRLERALVDLVLGALRLRRRLDIDKRYRCTNSILLVFLGQQLHTLNPPISLKML